MLEITASFLKLRTQARRGEICAVRIGGGGLKNRSNVGTCVSTAAKMEGPTCEGGGRLHVALDFETCVSELWGSGGPHFAKEAGAST